MKRTMPPIRSILKVHGGKTYLIRNKNSNLISLFPEHKTYIEPFAGGLSPLLAKPKSEVEIACDLNPWVSNCWISLINHPKYFHTFLNMITYKEENFLAAKKAVECNQDKIEYLLLKGQYSKELACEYIIKNRFSRSGHGEDFAWSERLRGGIPGDANGWKTFLYKELNKCADRVKNVDFRCDDGLRMMKGFNYPNTFCYFDPPYPQITRTSKNSYNDYEMKTLNSERDRCDLNTTHEDIINYITSKQCHQKILISSYHNQLYDSRLTPENGWWSREFNMANSSGQTKVKQRRTEVVWGNYEI